MAESSEKRSLELRRSIDLDQTELERALRELKTISKERLSLRHYMEAAPYKLVLGASVIGLLLGMRAARKRIR